MELSSRCGFNRHFLDWRIYVDTVDVLRRNGKVAAWLIHMDNARKLRVRILLNLVSPRSRNAGL